MKPLRTSMAIALVLFIGVTSLTRSSSAVSLKEKKIRGYITAFTSPTSFEIEDYKVTHDESFELELDNKSSDPNFKPEDLRIGTLVEIRGLFNEETNELKATKMKIDLKQFRTLGVTAVLDRKPRELQQTEGEKWQGEILADGRLVRITADTIVQFKLNKIEKKEAAKKAKELKKQEAKNIVKEDSSSKQAALPSPSPSTTADVTKPVVADDSDDFSEEVPADAGPLRSLGDLGPGVVMTYEGKEQADGTVAAKKVTFVRNEMEKDESKLWKKLKVKEKPANYIAGKPGELKVGTEKFKILPNQEVQEYVNRLGQSVVPQYQRYLPDSDPQKIPFKFVVIVKKGFNAGAFPNGVIIIHSEVFEVLENEAQLAAILSHEIAHATAGTLVSRDGASEEDSDGANGRLTFSGGHGLLQR